MYKDQNCCGQAKHTDGIGSVGGQTLPRLLATARPLCALCSCQAAFIQYRPQQLDVSGPHAAAAAHHAGATLQPVLRMLCIGLGKDQAVCRVAGEGAVQCRQESTAERNSMPKQTACGLGQDAAACGVAGEAAFREAIEDE